jgi:hypothetical protein
MLILVRQASGKRWNGEQRKSEPQNSKRSGKKARGTSVPPATGMESRQNNTPVQKK